MNGEVHTSYTREGLSIRMIVPLTHERWPTEEVTSASEAENA
jgi:hypothetical protein